MARRSYRGRHRGVYISPIMILAVLAIVVLGGFLLSRGLGGGEDAGDQTDQIDQIQGDTSVPTGSAAPDIPKDTTSSEPLKNVTTPSGIPCVLTELAQEDIHTGDLVLVNNWDHFHFPQQEQELVCVYEEKSDGYYVRDLSILVTAETMEAMDKMLMDFRAQGGSKSVNVVAGHRTAEFQQGLFDRSAERNGLEHAQKYVAQPGGSEHHTGLAVDFSVLRSDGSSADYDGTGEYVWINENCHRYGFIVRYETGKESLTGIYDEPWHFRYLGVPHATQVVKEGLCYEEYVDYLKDFTFEEDHLIIDCETGKYEVWYTEGARVYLPEKGEYQLSGNNVDGFIVTCKVG